MNSSNFKQLLPIGAAVIISILLSLAYFSPVLDGQRLKQGDITRFLGMAQEIQEHRSEFDEEPLWSGSMFAGMPAYQMSVKWNSNLLKKVHTVLTLGIPRPASMFFLYLMGMFFLLKVLRVNVWLCIVGAIAFALSSYFLIIIEAGHNSKALAVAYMAPTLGAFILLYRGKLLLGASLLALFMGLELTMNHPQVTYYLGFVLLFFALAEGVRAARAGAIGDFVKRSGVGLVAVALAAMCSMGSLWATYEYGKYTTRGKSDLTITATGEDATANQTSGLDRDYITDWSYGIEESMSLLVPNAKGGATGNFLSERENLALIKDQRMKQVLTQQGGLNAYWGNQRFTSGPVYLGAIIVLLLLLSLSGMQKYEMYWAVAALPVSIVLTQIGSSAGAGILVLGYILAGLAFKPDPLRYALWSGLFLTLLLSWGKNYMPLTDFFLDYVPGYNKFRAVTIILIIVELAAPVLGILYLDKFLKQESWDKENLKRFLIPAGALTLFLLFAWATPTSMFDMLSDAERESFNAQIASAPAQEANITDYANGLKEIRVDVFKADAMRSLGFVLAAIALLFFYTRGAMNKVIVIGGLGLLILVDMWIVDKRYLHNEKDKGRYEKWEPIADSKLPHVANKADLSILRLETTPTVQAAAESRIAKLTEAKKDLGGRASRVTEKEQQLEWFSALRRNSHYRVLNVENPWNDARTSYYHKSIGGYHGAKMKRYNELIDFYLTGEVQQTTAAFQEGATIQSINAALGKNKIVNMLNTKYLSYNANADAIVNLNASGPAWFVDGVTYVEDANAEITGLKELDLKSQAIAHRSDEGVLGASALDPSATISLDEYRANYLKYTTSSSKEGVAVFSEIWYGPEWQAYIDESPVEHARVNYVLRGLKVPAGAHTVEFKLNSKAYNTGSLVNTAASALTILLALGMLFVEFKNRKEHVDLKEG